MSWISNSVVRAGECCGTSSPDRCLQFNVTLHPDAAGIIFDIASGAVPPGALYYQVNCGTPQQVGTAMCLSGAGPHILTFCKPGNNPNQYSITSVPKASVTDTVRTSYFCTKKIGTRGFVTSTLTWTSVYPDNIGDYDDAINCTSGCDSVTFTAAKGLPQVVKYQVCGMMQSGCISTMVCDTVTILIADPLSASITPANPIICFGDAGVNLNLVASGGVLPYNVLWSNGSTANSVFATTAGKFAVRLTDASGCVIVSDSVTVIANPKLNANAGRDTSICRGFNFNVGGSPTASGGRAPYSYLWTASSDTLSSATVSNPQASPFTNNSFIVRVTDANGCVARDTMVITVGTCNVVCNGATGPNLLGSMGTFSSPYITPNNTTSAACIRNGTAAAPFNNIGNSKPNQTSYVYAQTSGGLGPEGRYTFVKALGDGPIANCLHNDFRGLDRTADGGYFMAINGSPNQTSFGATFFRLDSIPVCPNTDYEFSAWLANLKTGTQSHPAGSFPNIAFFINNVIVAVSGPVGPTNGQWFNNWQKSGGTWNSQNQPYANIRIDNYTFVASGNDLALDDIHFKVCGPVIISQTSRTLYCEGDEVIIRDSVACTNGQLYSWYRWQRSLDGGLTWSNVSGIQSSGNNAFYPATLAPFTATPALDNSKYRLMVSLDSNSLASANPNCIIYGSITTIKVGTAPTIKAEMFDTICPGTEAILSPKIDGGTAPFYLQWKNVQTNATASTSTYQFPVNQSTDIILNVTDTAGCKASDTIHFEPAPILNFKKGVANVLCNGGNTGSIEIIIDSFAAPYTFTWADGNTSNPRTNLAAGNYKVTIADRFGCTVADSSVITQPSALSASPTVNHIACSIDNTGAIQLNVSGGVAPYQYLWNNSATTASITGLNAGNYSVTVADNNTCSIVRNIAITQSDSITATVTTTVISCFGTNTGTATVSVSGGNASYQYLWSNGNTTNTIQNLAAGNYAVTITDTAGCTKIANATITSVAQLTTSINKTDPTCFGDKGKAKATITGGTAPFTFSWSNGSAIDSISNVAAGNYSLTVTDANNCLVTSNTTITQPDSISFSGIAVTNVLCFGNTTGSVSITTVAGGTAPYTHAWSNGATTKNISGIAAGSYSITVTDSKGCTATRSVTITQPSAALSASGVATNLSCFNQNNGSITLTVAGGTPSYTYVWSNGASSANLNNIAAGTYSVTVRDANNCSVTQSFTIIQPQILSVALSKTDATCFGDKGKAKAIVSGGTAPFTFAWSNGSAIDSIINVSAGNYAVTVSDLNGCSAIANTTITQPDSISFSGIAVTNVLCFGNATGSVFITTVTGGTAPYTYAWSNGATTKNISGVAAGSYTITVTDSKGCTTTRSFTITQPSAALSASGTTANLSCFNQNNGSITLNVAGGTPSYTYTWSNGASSANLNNIAAGTYSVTVRDANDCSVTQSFTITQPQTLSVALSKTDATCFGDKGKAKAIVSGGTAPFTFAWSNGSSIDSISNVSAGNYAVTVSDLNGCSTTASVTITQPDSVSLSGIAVTNVLCFGNNTGSITIATVAGGTTPYTYAWSNSSTTKNISGITAGSYTITVTDSKGCTTTRSFTITQPSAALSASGVATNLSCFNQNNGSITLGVTGGSPSYTYTWSNGASTSNLNNIAAGTYSVTVRDANSCSVTQSFNITQPQALSVALNKTDATCFGDKGKAKATITGGTAPFSFAWSNGSAIDSISNVSAGSYSLTVTDANNCSAISNTTITQPDSVSLSGIAVTNVLCFGNTTGSVSITTVAGGTSPYTYAWSNGATTKNISGVAAGSYAITVTDSRGCTATRSFTITQPSAALSASGATANLSCFNQNNGSITLTVAGGTTPYTYNWSNSASTSNLNNIAAGSYAVTVIDANNCSVTQSFTITQPQTLAVALSKTDATCFGDKGKAKVIVSGGTAPCTFAWSNGSSIDSISNVSAGNYAVTVSDLNGCSTTASITITQPDSVSLSGIAVTNVLCFGNNTGSITIATVAGGTSPYTYAWSNGATTKNITGVAAGSYTITVTDSKGCSATRSFVIAQPSAALNASGTIKNLTCFNKNDGAIQLNVNGGTAPYTYTWSNGSTTKHQSSITAGSYAVTVGDANGCSTTESFSITHPDSFSVNAMTANALCVGDANGKIQLNVTGATAPYSFAWSNQSNASQIQNLVANSYSVTISDSRGCSATKTYFIAQPNAVLSASATATNVSCNNLNNGSIQLNATGGTTPYSYAWNTGATTNSIQQLSAGSYQATVTDANGCSTISNATITQPDSLKLNAIISNVSCTGTNSGNIDLQPIGGNAPYLYNWSNGKVSQDIQQLAAGTYNVQVADSKGCYATGSYAITQPQPLTMSGTPSVNNVSCNGTATGSISLQVQGGSTPYKFVWNNGAATSTVSNLAAGNYSVTITDASQCSLTVNQSITQPSAIQVNMYKTDETCFNKYDGTAQATAIGGTPPYRYFWSNGVVNPMIANLSKGNYVLTVSDANACSVQSQALIASPDSLKASANIKPITCNGKSDGAVSLSVQGGTNPYQYQWSNGANTSGANNLAAGVYSAIITDAKGCSTVGSYAVKQPDPIQLSLNKSDITCNSKNNGVINLNVNGGIPPYTFLWTNNQTTTTVSNLGVGGYAVTVKDANQCSKSDSTNIIEPSPIIVAAAITDANCFGEASGGVVTLASGGVAPYSYLWNTGSTQKDIQQLAAGTYKLTVADNNGCTRIAQATVAQPQPIQIQFAVQHNKCFGGSEGEVQANVTGGNLPYAYTWSNGGNTPSIKGVISGDYDVDIIDVKGCVATGATKVNQPTELTATITTKGVSCTNQNGGSATVAANGGTAPYQYVWMTGSTNTMIANLSANTVVSVDVKDANGCTVTQHDTIREIPAMNIDAITENISCKKNDAGSISVTVENGASPYNYAWSNGQKNSSIVVNAAGSYGVTVTDRNGCTVTANYTITADSGFTINTISAQTIKLGEVVELTTNTTSANIRSWMWSPANFDAGLDCSNCQSPNAQPKKTTTYLVKALDNKGCEAIDTVTISVVADHTVFTPNMFSPNGDGVNDVFEIYGNHDALKEYDIKIFNRWGEKIYESSDPRFQWDGTYKDIPQDPGVFVYFMKVIFLDGFKPDDDGKGSITLVR